MESDFHSLESLYKMVPHSMVLNTSKLLHDEIPVALKFLLTVLALVPDELMVYLLDDIIFTLKELMCYLQHTVKFLY